MNIWIWGALAFLTALFISLLLGNPTINFLKKAGCVQEIKMDGPAWHKKKSGTPTMGGIAFIFSILLVALGMVIYYAVRGEQNRFIPLGLPTFFDVTAPVTTTAEAARVMPAKSRGYI